MKRMSKPSVFGVVAIAAGMLLMSSAAAWYQRPYAGAMTYERQNQMRDHGYGMQDLARMFDGRRAFNREEALRLARELEAGFADSELRNFAPGAVVAGSRVAPWTWRQFGVFRGYAEAAEQSAGRLAEALEQELSSDQVKEQGAWIPTPGRGYGRWGHQRDGAIALEAVSEYGRLNATCHSCHMLFRGFRW